MERSSLELFSNPAQEVEEISWVDVFPKTAIETSGKLVFQFQSDRYVDLSRSHLLFNVKRNDESENESIYPINNILDSYWRKVTLSINGELIASNYGDYGYKSYVDELLFSSFEYQLSQAGLRGFFPPPRYASVPLRLEIFKNGLQVLGVPHHDFCMQSKLIPKKANIEFTFYPQEVAFYMKKSIDKNDSKGITAARPQMRMCTVSLRRELDAQLTKELTLRPAVYPYMSTRIATFNMTTATAEFTNIFDNSVPEKVVVMAVDQTYYDGSQLHSPYNFTRLDEISSFVDGQPYPFPALKGGQTEADYTKFLFTDSDSRRYGNTSFYVRNGVFAREYLYCFPMTLQKRGVFSLKCKKSGTTGNFETDLKIIVIGYYQNEHTIKSLT